MVPSAHNEPILKTGIPDHIDALPLTAELQKPPCNQRLEFYPGAYGEIARRLGNHELDVGLIPVIHYSLIRAHRSMYILPGICVASGEILKSVMLIFNRGLERLNRIAVPADSVEYVPLLQIVLKEKYGVMAEIEVKKEDAGLSLLHHYDAALISGIPALSRYDCCDNHLDLSGEWLDMTDGLPLVFAFWAAGSGKLSSTDVPLFQNARADGVARIPLIAETFVQTHSGNSPDLQTLTTHLSQSLSYEMRRQEIDGVREYLTYCYYYGLIQEIPELHFLE